MFVQLAAFVGLALLTPIQGGDLDRDPDFVARLTI